ncbi:MAG: phosphoglycerate kinase, partial [Chloroflexi bacterium]|nr:phosphoglycerate kinase [Chloroflexota bacterium]
LLLPVDVMIAGSISGESAGVVVDIRDIARDKYIVDIGPRTIDLFSQKIKGSRTVFWNGPMGVYEIPQFASGTKALVNLLAGLEATTIIGGGSTAEIVEEMNLSDKMTHVSTGGGASLKFLEGKILPGVAALLDK